MPYPGQNAKNRCGTRENRFEPSVCKKENDIPQLPDAAWIADFGFAVDVTAEMNELNVELQRKGLFKHDM